MATKDKRLIGIYVGLWMGDGTQYYEGAYTIEICSHKCCSKLNLFIQRIIYLIFSKNTMLLKEKNTNRAYIKFRSKFIFDFIHAYVDFKDDKKTNSVQLKKPVDL